MIPAGHTREEALGLAIQRRRLLWSRPVSDEGKAITQLEDYCTQLHGGDRVEGEKLAREAIWS